MLGRDISFPKTALPTICTQIDEGLIPPGSATSMYGRIDWVLDKLKAMKDLQPGGDDFTIFHGSRNAYDARSNFALTRHQFVSTSDIWLREDYDLDCDRFFCAPTIPRFKPHRLCRDASHIRIISQCPHRASDTGQPIVHGGHTDTSFLQRLDVRLNHQ
jgi:hypothetical protein